MLLEFRVRNFRTFRDETTLSLVARTDAYLAEQNTMTTGLPQPARAVRSAAIYGANASGKTNLFRALGVMHSIVLRSASMDPDQPLPFQPFRLDVSTVEAPSLFEVTILIQGVRYQYGFEFTAKRIVSEWLMVYQSARPQRWIDRNYESERGSEHFDFSSHLVGPKRVWREATRHNALFLSTAVQLNSDVLRPLYQWFQSSLHVFLDGGHIEPEFTVSILQDHARAHEIAKIMNAADIAITSIALEKQTENQRRMHLDLMTGKLNSKRETVEVLRPTFEHSVGQVHTNFQFEEESLGTQKLFGLVGPILDILDEGSVLVVDEIDRSLHPLLVRRIIESFHNPEVNRHGAQLIFSTHDTSLLDPTLLRRDQIWFTEKDASQSAALVPLSDFSPRKMEALEKGYLSGRYGGIPILNRRLITREESAEK